MTDIILSSLLVSLGFFGGLLVSALYYDWEYRAIIGFCHAAKYQALKEKFERGELK